MKITFVTHVYPYPQRGFNPGIERVIEELSLNLAAKGHKIRVITTYRNDGILKKERYRDIEINRIKDTRHILGKIGSVFACDYLSINYLINRYYKEILKDSDVIHAFTPFVNVIPNVPLISHFHHEEKIRNPKELLFLPMLARMWEKTYEASNAVISVSNYSSKDLVKKRILKANIFIVPNGVDVKRFYPNANTLIKNKYNNANILLYVGPLIKRKGIEYIIKAMPRIISECGKTILLIVGEGSQDYLRKIAAMLNVTDNVIFKGFVSEENLSMYYNGCDIFVFPSLQEGFGMVMAEAMACGKPVIAANTSAIPEVLGDAGSIVPPRDSHALSEAVITLLKDEDKRLAFEERAIRRIAKLYTWDKVSEKVLQIYNKVL